MLVLNVRCGLGEWSMMNWLGLLNIVGLWLVVPSSVVILCLCGICMMLFGRCSLMLLVVVCLNRCSGEL